MDCTLEIKRFEQLTLNELYEILWLRSDVFQLQQNSLYMDLDGLDQGAIHVFYKNPDGTIEGYLRVLDRGVEGEHVAIGRLINRHPGNGLGKRLMLEGIRVAREAFAADAVMIMAQVYLRDFYLRMGFRPTSDEFMAEGRLHQYMLLQPLPDD